MVLSVGNDFLFPRCHDYDWSIRILHLFQSINFLDIQSSVFVTSFDMWKWMDIELLITPIDHEATLAINVVASMTIYKPNTNPHID